MGLVMHCTMRMQAVVGDNNTGVGGNGSKSLHGRETNPLHNLTSCAVTETQLFRQNEISLTI